LTIVSSEPCRVHSSETQLTTDNATVGIIPFVITDSTPAKGRMKYFDSSCFGILAQCSKGRRFESHRGQEYFSSSPGVDMHSE
jgi:hypothetical protein